MAQTRDPSAEGLLARNRAKFRHGYQDKVIGGGKPASREEDEGLSFDSRSSLDASDLDATEFLDNDPLDPPRHPDETKPAFLGGPGLRPPWSLRRSCAGRSRCCLVLVALGISIWVLLGAAGGFVYKKYSEEPPYGQSPPWYPTPRGGSAREWKASYAKAARMVANMTLAEKVNVTTGTGWQMGLAVGQTGPALLVGFPQLFLQDGPQGMRFTDNATAWPSAITLGATWNKKLMYERAKAHGAEARAKGINALLGPCVGPLGRMPAGGRNWEGFGADPYLQGVAGAETVRGIQSENVMATIKHFVGNEQEHFRQAYEWGLPHAISSNMDDRTLHELYAWPFGDAVKAGVASVMCSYNMLNNSYACGNSKLLNGILKDELGFQGFVMSDWRAQRSGVASALAGLDMTMPGDGLRYADGTSLWGSSLSRAVLNGSVPVDRLNDMVTRIVAAWYQLGQDDETKFPRDKLPNFSSWTNDRMGKLYQGSPSEQPIVKVNDWVNVQANHSILARRAAAEGIVLLKNKNVLPLSRRGFTDAKRRLSRRHSGGPPKIGIFGEDAGPGKGPNFCPDRGCNQGTLASGFGSGAVEFPYLVSPVEALRREFNTSRVELHEYLTNSPPPKSDFPVLENMEVCLVFANSDSGEGYIKADGIAGDRPDLRLQKGGEELIRAVAARCGDGYGDVVVVIHAVGPVVMEPWIDLPNIKAVLLAGLPGEESGNALADVLFGDVNPSGRLPYTIGRSLADYGLGAQVMYLPNGVIPQQDFSDGLYIDYRHFDRARVAPRFEFGFGLSYTTFDVAIASATPLRSKSPLPAAPPLPGARPPSYPLDVPPASEALAPNDGFRPLDNYVYPYVASADDLVSSEPYAYPEGYDTQQTVSGAGGGEGGNPDLWVPYVTVRAGVRNTGATHGSAVVQLYLGYPQDEYRAQAAEAGGTAQESGSGGERSKTIDFPEKVLRGFEKVHLAKGEARTVEFNLTRRDLSYWDVEMQNWVMPTRGSFKFLIGQSSRDLTAFAKW